MSLRRIDGADLDVRRGRRRHTSAASRRADTGIDRRAGHRIAGDAAAEIDHPAGERSAVAFAEEIDRRRGRCRCPARRAASCGCWRAASASPTRSFTWLPICPAIAMPASGSSASAASSRAVERDLRGRRRRPRAGARSRSIARPAPPRLPPARAARVMSFMLFGPCRRDRGKPSWLRLYCPCRGAVRVRTPSRFEPSDFTDRRSARVAKGGASHSARRPW